MREEILRLLFAIVLLIFIKLIINVYRLARTKLFMEKYTNWILSETRDYSMTEFKSEVVELWKAAGIKNCSFVRLEDIGYGNAIQIQEFLFDHFPSIYEDMAFLTKRSFHEAIGVYKKRIIESVNPLYWIMVIIDWPQKLTDKLNLHLKQGLVNVFRLVWWVLGLIATLYLSLYPEHVKIMLEKSIGI